MFVELVDGVVELVEFVVVPVILQVGKACGKVSDIGTADFSCNVTEKGN